MKIISMICFSCKKEYIPKRKRVCSDGHYRCKACAAQRRRKSWRVKNPDWKRDPEKNREISRAWYWKSEENKKKMADRAKTWNQTEKGKAYHRERQRVRYHQNPEYYRLKARANSRYGGDVELIKRVLDRGSCMFCGTKERLTIDHGHPLSKGGTNVKENLYCLCVSCNSFKSNKLITASRYPGVIL